MRGRRDSPTRLEDDGDDERGAAALLCAAGDVPVMFAPSSRMPTMTMQTMTSRR